MQTVPAGPASTLISCIYVGDPLESVMLFDNSVIAWIVDETGGGAPPVPVILGTQPTAGPDTSPVLSPSWALLDNGTVFVPDMVRGSTNDFFAFMATNNGANRKVYAKFSDPNLATDFSQWSTINPSLALSDPPGTTGKEGDDQARERYDGNVVLNRRDGKQFRADEAGRQHPEEGDEETRRLEEQRRRADEGQTLYQTQTTEQRRQREDQQPGDDQHQGEEPQQGYDQQPGDDQQREAQQREEQDARQREEQQQTEAQQQPPPPQPPPRPGRARNT